MGKNKRKNFTPSALREIDDELRIVKSLNYRDIVWKAGDLVSVIEDDVEYYAQERLISFRSKEWLLTWIRSRKKKTFMRQ